MSRFFLLEDIYDTNVFILVFGIIFLDEAKQNVAEFKNSVTKVKKSVDSFTSGDALGLKKVMPIITTLIDLDKRK